MAATEQQKNRVNKIICRIGIEEVNSYIHNFYPDADISNLTKKQAQKIITGLGHKSLGPVFGIFMRDYY